MVTCAYTEARWDDLVAGLESVRRQTRAPDEVILVIDHNARLLERAKGAFLDVRVVENSHGQGASGARNTGSAMAHSEIVTFLDDDARATPTWLAELTAPFDDPVVAGVGGKAIPLWPSDRPAWFPAEFDWVIGCSFVGLPETRGRVRNVMGTNLSVRRHLIAAVGGFREGFGNVVSGDPEKADGSDEDADFCIRVVAKHPGMTWIFQPSATVYHRVSARRATFRYFLSRCWMEGKGKAILAAWLGESVELTVEREYALKVLPRGIVRGLRDAVRERRADGIRRAGAIAAGFGATGVAYVVNRYGPRGSRARRTGRWMHRL